MCLLLFVLFSWDSCCFGTTTVRQKRNYFRNGYKEFACIICFFCFWLSVCLLVKNCEKRAESFVFSFTIPMNHFRLFYPSALRTEQKKNQQQKNHHKLFTSPKKKTKSKTIFKIWQKQRETPIKTIRKRKGDRKNQKSRWSIEIVLEYLNRHSLADFCLINANCCPFIVWANSNKMFEFVFI